MGWAPKIHHEVFAAEYVLCGGRTVVAYRRTREKFPNCFRGKPCNDRFNADQLKRKPWMQRRIRHYEGVVVKKGDITIEKILTDLEDARLLAKGMSKPSDMISASGMQAKVAGLMTERIETGAPGAFDQTDNVSDILQAVAAKQGPEAALVLAKQFGVALDITETAKEEAAPEELMVRKPPTDSVN